MTRSTSGKSFLEMYDDYKYQRYTASHRFPLIKVDGGGYYCKFCGKAVPPRTKLKWFCDKTCHDEMDIRKGLYKYRIKNRDKGICAICGVQNKYEYHIDHIIPVVEGGGCCGLDNLRTLCVPCHKEDTKALAKRRAEKRKQ